MDRKLQMKRCPFLYEGDTLNLSRPSQVRKPCAEAVRDSSRFLPGLLTSRPTSGWSPCHIRMTAEDLGSKEGLFNYYYYYFVILESNSDRLLPAHAPTGNRTGNLLVHWRMLQLSTRPEQKGCLTTKKTICKFLAELNQVFSILCNQSKTQK